MFSYILAFYSDFDCNYDCNGKAHGCLVIVVMPCIRLVLTYRYSLTVILITIDTDRQKAVFDSSGRLLWISRFPIPYPQGTSDIIYHKQAGVVAASKEALRFFTSTKRGIIETAEENDLMRFLENGKPVYARIAEGDTLSIDSHKDIAAVEQIIRSNTPLHRPHRFP